MNRRRVVPPSSASSTSTSGSTPASLASISVCSALTFSSINLIKKAGERPLSVLRREPPGRKAVNLRLALLSSARGDLAAGWLCCTSACAIPVHPVIAAAGLERCGQRKRLASLRVPAEQLQAAPQAEERKIVGRSLVDDRLELLGG